MLKDNDSLARTATLGRIIKPCKTKGEVSLRLRGGVSLTLFEKLASAGTSFWVVPPPLERRVLQVEYVQAQADSLRVKFVGIANRSQAQELSGHALVVDSADLSRKSYEQIRAALVAEREANEASQGQVGLLVFSDAGEELGRVVEVLETGANQVWVVRNDEQREVLLPVIDDCIRVIDEQKRQATVTVMKGLL
jgi:16S rRNA processing protein RimM